MIQVGQYTSDVRAPRRTFERVFDVVNKKTVVPVYQQGTGMSHLVWGQVWDATAREGKKNA